MDQLTIALQEFAMKLLVAAIYALVPVAVMWIARQAQKMRIEWEESRPEIVYAIERAAEIAVKAAEQVNLSGALGEFADSKLDYALDIAQKYLDARGLKNIDLDLLRAAIEAAVKDAAFPHVVTEKPV